jgi:transposase
MFLNWASGFTFAVKQIQQSKGKVENVVKFVKNNFLNCRAFFDTDGAGPGLVAKNQKCHAA